MLIGICGYAQSGKDTVCSILQHHGIVSNRFAFADPIKQTCNAMFGWDDRHAFGDLKETEVEFLIDHLQLIEFRDACEKYGLDNFGMSVVDIENALLSYLISQKLTRVDGQLAIKTSPREVYQVFGTEVGRDQLHNDVWVLIAPINDVAIPDVRFPNEAAWLKKNDGILIRVKKDDAKPVRPHVSESYIEQLPADLIIDNNGNFHDLESQIMKIFSIPEDANRMFPAKSEPSYNLTQRREILEEIGSVHCQHGLWNHSPYLHGFTNGLLLAQALLNGDRDAEFKATPSVWQFQQKNEPPITAENMMGAIRDLIV